MGPITDFGFNGGVTYTIIVPLPQRRQWHRVRE